MAMQNIFFHQFKQSHGLLGKLAGFAMANSLALITVTLC